ncbi:RNA helicase protein [Dioscorea alata]|uniref:RNA helicase protein n=1 Tax=Dioscorea alata TaxID=55571 RepID=A0ACB7W040_DIOAL|nr:RNA helicase protein [Dioscorea alata]
MAMPSTAMDGDFDNDGFDWEAAVREIDSACEAVATSSTYVQDADFRPSPAGVGAGARAMVAKPNGKARQSTLDRFVDSYLKRRHYRAHGDRSPERGNSSVETGIGNGDPQIGIDVEAAKTWIYPINVPLRDYQFSITKSALFSNTLVALPTGLGKTLIAAVVMFNYFRWFPEGKIVFTAPSRPLVMQQIEACHNIVGIPQEWTIDMTGQMSPMKRSGFWKVKRVFFVTPQVLEKDIQSGICLVKQLVCLVIDEAHRAMGNYSYCVAVRELMAVPVQLRILALTATPGSKQQTVQNVIDNLCISTLEYRNESDPDVSPYVHDRKLEVVQVALAKDAVDINNLLLDAIQPFVARLCAIGVLYNRDFTMLSPCELLNSRDKFRQVPPPNLPQARFGEVEGCFAVLITLYHLRKLLSTHGIRPAYDMLEEKLHQGSFARLMSRNETIWKAKLLMQQSLSHGAPNPKLVKMTEILLDHFKTKDPRESRVIIFSNFRGSVKDIMDSLSNIGDLVKATEFIGQSSGKTLKGQTQKVQQAVLQKFRTGGYNVIVATSIGEEGLDIMEVDLVICFDANISPLRMIQRMGRTGRNHDGRVVVLACEGSELKGYLKKQASSKTVRKHMHNGGIKSFDFHSSPRMIPHICKPQVQFVELAIEQFIPRGRKLKDGSSCQSPIVKKISDGESALLNRYFHPSKKETWRPSLISFPHFQAFPSGVFKVPHAFKTTAMLIDAMQRLQGPSVSKAKQAEISFYSPEDDTFEHDEREELADVHCAVSDSLTTLADAKNPDVGKSCDGASPTEKEIYLPDSPVKKYSGHCFLSGEQFLAVSTSGIVSVLSVPVLPPKGFLVSNLITTVGNKDFMNMVEKDAGAFARLTVKSEPSLHARDAVAIEVSTEQRSVVNRATLASQFSVPIDQGNGVARTTLPQWGLADSKTDVSGMPCDPENDMPSPPAAESRDTCTDLSPRLSHYIEEGIVPESPIVEQIQSHKVDDVICNKHGDGGYGSPSKYPPSDVKMQTIVEIELEGKEAGSPVDVEIHTPLANPMNYSSSEEWQLNSGGVSKSLLRAPTVDVEIHTPLANPMNNSSSEEWQLNSGGVSKSLLQAPKYRRLRKHGEVFRRPPCNILNETSTSTAPSNHRHSMDIKFDQIDRRKGKRSKNHANYLIDEEAEVSQDAEVSEDEEDGDKDDEYEDSDKDDEYEDSFIDDKTNPTPTQAEHSGDMLAFYRRSLLTQSPFGVTTSLVPPHGSVSPRTIESGSSSVKTMANVLETPQDSLRSANQSTGLNSVTCPSDSKRVLQISPHIEAGNSLRDTSDKVGSRKRKLTFQHAGSSPAAHLQHATSHPEHITESSNHYQAGNTSNGNESCDDDFYKSVDLDAIEEQATKLLRYKAEVSISQTQMAMGNQLVNTENTRIISTPPTFDLGI